MEKNMTSQEASRNLTDAWNELLVATGLIAFITKILNRICK